MTVYYLAVDIGASSGRHIVGWHDGQGALKTREVYRFPNGVSEINGHLNWDIKALEAYVREGIDRAMQEFGALESLSIDTWGVDYVLMRGEEPVFPAYAYRDDRTEAVIEGVHEKIPFSELYAATGCQFQPFNSIYQLAADFAAGRLEGVTDWLMIPEYLMYCLCGVKAREYTNATTSGLVNAATGQFDHQIVQRLGLPESLFPQLMQPGEVLGEYCGIKVMLCATHDTGSAVEGMPLEPGSLYLSSGTWSLLGVKVPRAITTVASRDANYSNEGGVGYVRYQKNIMGMWLVNELRRELCPEEDFARLVEAAQESAFDQIVDANDAAFMAPTSMKAAFDEALAASGAPAAQTAGDYFRCAYLSLAQSYARAICELEQNTGEAYDQLTIVGGGAKNAFLNCLTAQTTGKKVVALPIEATALGNLKIQMEA